MAIVEQGGETRVLTSEACVKLTLEPLPQGTKARALAFH